MKSKKLLVLGLLILGLSGLVGCNIWSWTHSAGSNTSDAAALTADAESALSSGDYTKAMEYYEQAVSADPTNSKARYGYVNAYLKSSGLNVLEFAKSAGGQKSIVSAVSGLGIERGAKTYNLIDNPSKPYGVDVKKFETLGKVLVDYLEPIAKGDCDGKINKDDVEINLNLALGNLLRGIFLIVDPPTGNSGSIKYNLRKNDDGTVDIVDLNGNVISDATWASIKTTAISYLTTAITRLDTAIANSLVKDSKDWTQVRDLLVEVKAEINRL